ncbi:protoglobin domain-containing protein [Alkalicoccus chagannorensis]|uniref:globin domain-containing protein n=1 Tax=Alkalicoccus chagannorensis TaxID=427072 RepID=UPI00040C4A55|nr:protoglobin domain-containing protein [Alkalicoccus chagannorensis]
MNSHYTAYEALGEDRLHELVDTFYSHVEEHPELSPIFPDDMSETRRKQKQFLTQFFGGPALYTEEHGHPMLRAKHMQFAVTPERSRAWLSCMGQALYETGIEEPLRSYMFERFEKTAAHMINTNNSSGQGGSS